MLLFLKNDQGQFISGIRKLKKAEYGTERFDDNGEELVDWIKFKTKYADQYGFDMRKKSVEGIYCTEVILPHGTIIIRYGPESGKYTAPEGTSYDTLALPYERSTVEFHKYKVNTPLQVAYVKVRKGIVAPMFDSDGGAVQFYHFKNNIRELLKMRALVRIL